MGVEALENEVVANIAIIDESLFQDEPLNGADARRRLENKIEDLRLKRELQEFDFDL